MSTRRVWVASDCHLGSRVAGQSEEVQGRKGPQDAGSVLSFWKLPGGSVVREQVRTPVLLRRSVPLESRLIKRLLTDAPRSLP